MEGLFFEVKPRRNEPPKLGGSEMPRSALTSNRRSCPSLPCLGSSTRGPEQRVHERTAAKVKEEDVEEEIRYKLTMVGFLPVHPLTTMTMLPWVVAEISSARRHVHRGAGAAARSGGPGGGPPDPGSYRHTVCLCVSASYVRCVSVLGEGVVWDPLTHTVLFECPPHLVTKLIHNSQEPSSFAFLVKDTSYCACYVFQCQDSIKMGGFYFESGPLWMDQEVEADQSGVEGRVSSVVRHRHRFHVDTDEGKYNISSYWAFSVQK